MPRRLADLLDKQTDFRKATTERAGSILVRPPKPKLPGRTKIVGRMDADLDTNDLATPQELSVHEWDPVMLSYQPTGERVDVYGSPARRLGVILYQMWVEAEPLEGDWVAVAGGKARSIEFRVTTAFSESDPNIQGEVIDFRDGEDPDPSAAGLEIENTSGRFRGEIDATGTALYDPEEDHYYAIQIDCPPLS